MSRSTSGRLYAGDVLIERPMTIGQRLGAVVVALFAIAFTRAPALIRLFDPVMRRLLVSRVPAGPNVLLKVRGRRSGVVRATPVAFMDLGEGSLLQAASADAAWVRNLRAAKEAAIVNRGRETTYAAKELDPETGGRRLHELLAPFPRSGLVRTIVGRTDRPPVGVLLYFRLRVDDTLEQCVATARRQPLFELHRK